VLIPLALLGGFREVFKSSAWTLTFTTAAGQAGEANAPQPALPVAPQPEPA
jgi:hypothetical protein